MTRGLAFALLLCWLVVPCAHAAPDTVPVRADIQIRIDPETRELTGKGTWTVPPGESPAIVLDDRFEVRRLEVDGRRPPSAIQRDGSRQWRLAPSERATQRVEIEWQGQLDPLEAGLEHREVLRHALPVTAPRGTFLPGAAQWHPVFVGRPLQYTLRVDVPQSQRAIVAGDLASDRNTDGRRLQTYRFEQPDPAIDRCFTKKSRTSARTISTPPSVTCACMRIGSDPTRTVRSVSSRARPRPASGCRR